MKRTFLSLAVILTLGLLIHGCGEETKSPTTPGSDDAVFVLQRAGGNLSGAIFTTTPDGAIVNENVRYQSKLEVYLDGGPGPNAPQMAAGLPAGLYVFQVTDPPGKVLLSQDPAKCRVIRIEDDVIQELVSPQDLDLYGYPQLTCDYTVGKGGNAVTYPCHVQDDPDGAAGASGRHDTNTDVDHGDAGAIVVQLMPFADTPNPGGVYKAWVTPIDAYLSMGGDLQAVPEELRARGQVLGYKPDPGFGPPRNMVKTDNFKVREQPPLLCLKKYEDLDGDGEFDFGEPEIAGWKITVTEYLGDGTSVVNDYYTPACVRLHEGVTVDVTEEMPAGWNPSWVQVDGSYVETAVTVTLTLGPGQQGREVAFGNWECSDQGGVKYEDLDGDGMRDEGEPGLAEWPIRITGTNGAGVPVDVVTHTDANGMFSFECLAPGSYTVSELCDGEWVQVEPEPTGGCGSGVYEIIVHSGDVLDDLAFGNLVLPSLRAYKFFDRDLDGIPDPGESVVPDYEICLYDAEGNLVSCQLTNAEGYAEWTDLMPGTYLVEETLQPGWFATVSTEFTVELLSRQVVDVHIGNVANCVGLTPGYWKNWRNHYTEAQFMILVSGTIAQTIAEVDHIFAAYDASNPQDLTILKAFTLANQLTINLTQHPELPNPSEGSLFPTCTLPDDPDAMSLGDALARAIEIIGGAPASNEEILFLKTLLDRYANQRFIVWFD